MGDSNFSGLASTFPLLIEIKNENGVGEDIISTFAESTLSQQIDLILDNTIPETIPSQSHSNNCAISSNIIRTANRAICPGMTSTIESNVDSSSIINQQQPQRNHLNNSAGSGDKNCTFINGNVEELDKNDDVDEDVDGENDDSNSDLTEFLKYNGHSKIIVPTTVVANPRTFESSLMNGNNMEEDIEDKDSLLDSDIVDNLEIRTKSITAVNQNNDISEEISSSSSTVPGEQLKCNECAEKFDSKEIYEIHLAGHANNMKCPVCNMVLKSLRNYEKHCIRCKPYECQICGRVVRFRPNFIKHMRVHSTEQSKRHKYKCEICSKEFMSFEYFKVHKKIHNGNVNLTCNVCGKVFSALASLRGHSKLHTGIKLHKCEYCGKGFGQRYNLKIHIRVHTGEVAHKCKICRRKLHSLESYHNHMQKNHQDYTEVTAEPLSPTKDQTNLKLQSQQLIDNSNEQFSANSNGQSTIHMKSLSSVSSSSSSGPSSPSSTVTTSMAATTQTLATFPVLATSEGSSGTVLIQVPIATLTGSPSVMKTLVHMNKSNFEKILSNISSRNHNQQILEQKKQLQLGQFAAHHQQAIKSEKLMIFNDDNNIFKLQQSSPTLIGHNNKILKIESNLNQATILEESNDITMKTSSSVSSADDSCNNLDIILKSGSGGCGQNDEKFLSEITNISSDVSKFPPPEFENDIIDSSDLNPSLSYSNLFEPGSIPDNVPDDIYLNERNDDNDNFRLDQNFDLQSTTDGNFIRKEWVYSSNSNNNYNNIATTIGDKFDDDDFFEAASFIYD